MRIVRITKHQLRNIISEYSTMPHLNKYDPGSLLGQVVYILEKDGLDDAAKAVREVSKVVSQAWSTRGQAPESVDDALTNDPDYKDW